MSAVVGQTRGQGRETFLSAEHGGLTLQCEMGPRVSSRCIGIACAPGISGFWSRLCCYITVWPWRSHYISPMLSFRVVQWGGPSCDLCSITMSLSLRGTFLGLGPQQPSRGVWLCWRPLLLGFVPWGIGHRLLPWVLVRER